MTHPVPPYSDLGERLRERTEPLAPNDEQNDFAHAKLCEGMMLPFGQLAELVDPPDPYVPWEPLFDVAICPAWALPWLGQLVGARIPRGLSDDDSRMYVTDLGGFKRGSPEAIKHAVGLALTGTKTVYLRERDAGDPYRLEVVTLTSETPDPAAVLRAILLQKPGGIVVAYRTTVGWDYEQMTIEFGGKKYKDVPLQYPTYRQLTGGPLL